MRKSHAFRSIIFVFGAIVLSQVIMCTDYAYQHKVSGNVIDTEGQPVQGAIVRRVLDWENRTQYGLPSLYERKTDENGNFEFHHKGMGSKPKPREIWYLIVNHPDYEELQVSIEVQWQEPVDSNFGYIKEGIKLTLTRKGS